MAADSHRATPQRTDLPALPRSRHHHRRDRCRSYCAARRRNRSQLLRPKQSAKPMSLTPLKQNPQGLPNGNDAPSRTNETVKAKPDATKESLDVRKRVAEFALELKEEIDEESAKQFEAQATLIAADYAQSSPQSIPSAHPWPHWLRDKPTACEKWLELCAELEKRSQLDFIDRDLLALYCDCWQQITDADAVIVVEGEYFTTEKGYIGIHPAKLKRDKAIDRARKIAERLGIGIASRKNLPKPEPPPDPDGLDDFNS